MSVTLKRVKFKISIFVFCASEKQFPMSSWRRPLPKKFLAKTHETENSINHLRLNQSIEFAVSDLKDSIDFLGEIVGKKDNEDMLDTLFSTFCIGKWRHQN